jgi:hypothetical protein
VAILDPAVSPETPALRLVVDDPAALAGQVFYLDHDGASDVTYDGPVHVDHLEIPAFQAPGDLAGQEAAVVDLVLASLDERFSGLDVTFATAQPDIGTEYSTIHVGGADTAFSLYGSFLGLSEQVDVGNQDHDDLALIFSDEVYRPGMTVEEYASALAGVVEHEARHLLGLAHDDGDHDGLDALALMGVTGVPTWQPQGPAPISQASAPINPNVGAIQDVAVDPDKPDTIYIATVNGGVWKTTNGTSSSPTWTSVTDQLPSLSTSAITIDLQKPSSATTPRPVYAGTGSASSAGSLGRADDPTAPIGLLRSLDGGATWSLVGASQLAGKHIADIYANGKFLVVAAQDHFGSNGGLFFTEDALNPDPSKIRFKAITADKKGNPLTIKSATDLVSVPGTPSLVYAGIAGMGVLRSADSGKTWSPVNTGFDSLKDIFDFDQDGVTTNSFFVNVVSTRVRLAATPKTLYAAFVSFQPAVRGGTGEALVGLFRTTDLSDTPTWHFLNLPGDPADAVKVDLPRDGDTTAGNSPGETYTGVSPGGQAFKHFSLAVDFNNRGLGLPSETIYVGGDRQAIDNGTAKLSTTGANIFYGLDADLDTTGVSKNTIQWIQIVGGPAHASSLNFGRGTTPHADSRNIVIKKNGDVLEVDDGGIFRASLGTGVTPKWASLTPAGSSLQLGEVVSADYDPLTGRIIGGLWDNGIAIKSTPTTGKTWNEILVTDGHLVEATTTTIGGAAAVPTYFYSSANVTSAVTAWYDKNSNGKEDADEAVSLFAKDTGKSGTLPLIRDSDPVFARAHDGTWVLNSVDPARMLFGGNQLWEVSNLNQNPDLTVSGKKVRIVDAKSLETLHKDRKFTALVYGAKGNPDVIYAARDAANHFEPTVYVRSSAGGALTATRLPNTGADATFGVVVDIAIDPEDWQTAYAVLDEGGAKPDRVYKTTDAGKNWFAITGNLNDTGLKTIEVVEISGSSSAGRRAVLVGGHGGVYRAFEPKGTGGLTNTTALWTEFGKDLPNATVSDLRYIPRDSARPGTSDILVAGTVGRGVWTIPSARAELMQRSEVAIFGGSSDDTWVISRDRNEPWKVVVVEQLAGGTPTTLAPFQLSAVEKIVVNGFGGDDTLIIDITKGPIGADTGTLRTSRIDYNGGDANFQDHLALIGPGAADNQFVNSPADAKGASRILASDRFRTPTTQVVSWSDVEDAQNLVGKASKTQVKGVGLLLTGKWAPGVLGKAFPGLGSSLKTWASNQHKQKTRGVVEFGPAAAPEDVLAPDDGESFLLRLIETGLGGFDLAEVSEDGEISSSEALRAALDGLDAIPNNVTFTETADVTTFTMQVVKSLNGPADLDVAGQLLGGLLELSGAMEIAADVVVDLEFGVDETGFFLRPGAATPEIVLSNLRVTGDVSGTGQLGFLGVTVSDATLTLDPEVRIEVELRDPGTDAADGLIRLVELDENVETIATTTLRGNASAPDVSVTAKVQVAALLGSDEPLFDLGDARIKLTWADVNLPEQVTLDLTVGAGQEVLGFLQHSAESVLGGLASVAGQFQEVTGTGLFATKIPMLDKTLGEIMADLADPISIPDAAISFVSSVFEGDANRTFVVDAFGLDLVKQGVGVGDAVFYRSGGAEVQGTIAAVDARGFTVAFAAGLDQAPDATSPSFRIVGPGTIQSQVTSLLDGLRQRLSLHESTPTLQELLEEVAGLLGVDAQVLELRVTGTGLDRTIQFALPFDPDPISFTERLGLGASVPGLALDASADVKFTVDPQFRIPIGIRLHPDVPIGERFFLAEDEAPEITLDVSALIDDPSITGKVADVFQVRLQEDATVVPNQGIALTGTVTVNLVDPTSGAEADERITLDEFSPAELTDMFSADIEGALDIDGLTLTADVAGAGLGELKISIDGATDGHIDNLDDLIGVLSRIKVEGNLGLPEDIPIPAFVRDAILQKLLTVVD